MFLFLCRIDEIGQVTTAFNGMTKNLADLVRCIAIFFFTMFEIFRGLQGYKKVWYNLDSKCQSFNQRGMVMKIRHLRHATFHLHIQGVTLLVDPVLSPAAAMTPIDNSPNQRRNPLVELPVSVEEVMTADGCLLTHTHRDHFDTAAGEQLPKTLPVFCQPEDRDKLHLLGFTAVQPVDPVITWRNIELIRTGGQHGTGEIGRKMAPVSGYVLKAVAEPTLYIAGDTVWCPEVAETLSIHKPEVIVLYGGAARFNQGEPITMGKEDILRVCQHAPAAKVVVLHMEAINHCLLTRAELNEFIQQERLGGRVKVPADGQWLDF